MEKNNFDYTEERGKKNILKYFDRIHDKLFVFNNILIVGFFTLSQIPPKISMINILFPIINLCLFIFIEYRMMELSRTESYVKEIPINELENKLYNKYGLVTVYSLISIITTSAVMLIFLYQLLLRFL